MVFQIIIAIFLVTAIFCQSCQLINSQYNLINQANGEIYRLPLQDYFIGDGLSYQTQLNDGTGSAQVNKIYQGDQVTTYSIIDITATNLNGNPNIQTFKYFALANTTTGIYTLLSSTLQAANYNQVAFLNSFVNMPSNQGECLTITTIQPLNDYDLLIGCINGQTLIYQFTTSSSSNKGSFYNFTQSISSSTATGTTTMSTQSINDFIVSSINIGSFNSTTNTYVATYTALVVSIVQSLTNRQTFSIIQKTSGDYVTGFYISDQGLLFVTTFQTGLTIYNCNQVSKGYCATVNVTYPNPFTNILGLSVYNIDYSLNNYYVGLISSSQIITSIYNIGVNQSSLSTQQIIQTSQVTQDNWFQTQIYINLRYIVIVNPNGVNVYPSRFNSINDGRLLYSFNSTYGSITSAYDLFNNILVTINSNTNYAQTYQFNDPQIYLKAQNGSLLTVTATSLDGTICQQNFTILTQSNPVSGNQITIYNSSSQGNSQYYNQLGAQFDLVFGQEMIIDLNRLLIGPAIFIESPYIQPALSTQLAISYSLVIETPLIVSPYRLNDDLNSGQRILYAQNFYDPSFITIESSSSTFKDSFIQLIQQSENIILYECQSIANIPCQPIYYVNIPSAYLVLEFALGFQQNQITFAYKYYTYNPIQIQITIITIQYNNELGYYSELNNVVINESTFDGIQLNKIEQIAIISDYAYILYTDIDENIYFDAINIENLNSLELISISQYNKSEQTGTIVNQFYYNPSAYGNLIFADTGSSTQGQITVFNVNNNEISSVGQVYTGSGTDLSLTYGLTLDGIYVINSQSTNLWIQFYPRIELLPALYDSLFVDAPISLIGISIPLYAATQIQFVQSSTRFLYVMVQQQYEQSSSIFVYRSTSTILNSLYYVITPSNNEFISQSDFSVVSALQYDAILFKSDGAFGYRNAHLIPEQEIVVRCNLKNNGKQQIEYNYLELLAGSLLSTSQISQSWSSFQILNLISFVSELETTTSTPITLNSQSYILQDPRQYFSGNIESISLSNVNNDMQYYFQIQSTIYSPPQRQLFQNAVTAVSTLMSLNAAVDLQSEQQSDSNQQTYFYTFVQTNRLVLVTPYIYFTPQQSDFVSNSTIYVDFPLSYKLPILDPKPNSQYCPLIFVDSFSEGVVSVCGTQIDGLFLASFTLYDTQTQNVLETQIIDISTSFPIDSITDIAKYSLISGTYLQNGIVVLQYRYSYNIGSTPPTDIIVSFVYSASTSSKTVVGQNQQYYQLIQAINQVWYVPNLDLSNTISVSVFSLTNTYLAGLTQNSNSTSSSQLIFGLLCISNENQECLANSITSTTLYSGVTIQINLNVTSFVSFFSGNNITIDQLLAKQTTTNVITSTSSNIFDISIYDIISQYKFDSISIIVQANEATNNDQYAIVELVVANKGNAYIIELTFLISDGQFIQANYLCTLMGLTNENDILQISAQGGQIIMIVSNPSPTLSNRVTLLNYGLYQNYCSNDSYNQTIPTTTPTNIVTAIGSYSYESLESVPILQLMASSQSGIVSRTLISNNQYIQILDTNTGFILQAFPNYNIDGGVTLNYDNLNSTTLIQQISASPINTYINSELISGNGGSISLSLTPNYIYSAGKWDRKLWGQFIWGSFMIAIIIGILGFLFYKSEPIYN